MIHYDTGSRAIISLAVPTLHHAGSSESIIHKANKEKGSEWIDTTDAPYRYVIGNSKEFYILTYCEGDLSLEILDNQASYNQAKNQAISFYKEN